MRGRVRLLGLSFPRHQTVRVAEPAVMGKPPTEVRDLAAAKRAQVGHLPPAPLLNAAPPAAVGRLGGAGVNGRGPGGIGQSGGPTGRLLARSSMTATMSAETSHRVSTIGPNTPTAKKTDIVHPGFSGH